MNIATEAPSIVYAIAGNPNSGKTTVFNRLTGLRQKIANYPGVTVEAKHGSFRSQHGKMLHLIDLPGTYSLTPQSPDETIVRDWLLGKAPGPRPTHILYTVDAAHIKRGLYLAHQIAALGLPMVFLVTLTHGLSLRELASIMQMIGHTFQSPVLLYNEHSLSHLLSLKVALSNPPSKPPFTPKLKLPSYVHDAIDALKTKFGLTTEQCLLRLTEGPMTQDMPALQSAVIGASEALQARNNAWQSHIVQSRQQLLGQVCPQAKHMQQRSFDHVALHPVWGYLLLFVTFGLVFWSIFQLAVYPMQGIEWSIEQLTQFIERMMPVSQTRNLITQGIIAGVGNVLMFIPQILMLFFFLGLLEGSGYLPRAVLLLDRWMRPVGLQGRAFIPLLSSYACAIPGILATRTLPSVKERLLTIFIAPWMSCSARLPVYLLMITLIYPSPLTPAWVKAGWLMVIYGTSTLMALLLAWGLSRTVLRGVQGSQLLIELPPYRWPALRNISVMLWERLTVFLRKAGVFILAFSILFWALTHYPHRPELAPKAQLEQSFAGKLGKSLEPVLAPLGYDWKINVGLVSAFAARELFVSTMGILYNAEQALPIQDCGCGCCDKLGHSRSAFANILLNQTNTQNAKVYTPLTCVSLIVFYMFALQCTSTVAVVQRETRSWKWPLVQWIGMTGFAYVMALIVYQLGSWLI